MLSQHLPSNERTERFNFLKMNLLILISVQEAVRFSGVHSNYAFILLNLKRSLCALSDEDDGIDERGIVDLAWFPTGGGKTEAYWTYCNDWILSPPSKSEQEKETMVHTVMRYTLRLLTSDRSGQNRSTDGCNELCSRD